ncbi:MAG: Fumarate hydratase class II [Alphaproteobacteria bacterium MarineAlpha5_Bin11]|nr:fumarate hydratase, class II [Pelagibacteraceae bacterium]PPR43890.1 MAG: Fumarate hydratase class II [Alphaproteobacteria bacterium MarineAlpha5_Bin11]PPR51629.1 MAG: Fumarate hydratase class II [Alphaproteobacteria bacterium MarineAlpha5_Bin10]|tara:strand:+ start:6334 stop:7719 length:1386 start_codon:yes stop_codon:yes gene_type:complete
MTKNYRIENDGLGAKKVKNDKLWGAQTQRSFENFKIGEEKMPNEVIIALGYQKKAAAMTNLQLKKISKEIAEKIIKSCDEIISLKLIDHFPLSVWQTGSGTQTNMNANEVISNRAIQMLRGKLGSKTPIHPNDHINMSQSSNDVFPTVMHIACVFGVKNKLIPALEELREMLEQKEKQFRKLIKIGRTHAQDATPISLGQEFSGYREQIKKNKDRLIIALNEIHYIAQGGTAVGTGINAPKNFDKLFCKNLSKITKTNFYPAKNKFESISSHDSLVNLSASLNNIAVSLLKIGNDLRMLSSGPRSGLCEIILPENEPGSSIMPGKNNPTQIEALTMVCAKVIGNHTSTTIAGSQGHFQLNAFKPVIIYNLIQSINLLSSSIASFNHKCLKKLKANKKIINNNLKNSLMLITILTPTIGYDNATKIVKKAYKENTSLKEAANKLKLINSKDFDKLVDPSKMI